MRTFGTAVATLSRLNDCMAKAISLSVWFLWDSVGLGTLIRTCDGAEGENQQGKPEENDAPDEKVKLAGYHALQVPVFVHLTLRLDLPIG